MWDNNFHYTDATESEKGMGMAIVHKNLIIIYKTNGNLLHLYDGSNSNP